jgi:electron transfer flavoprotein-quinone oxidoreductase
MPTSPKFDVIIVGAGPAGITAAIALARAEIPVLVIEAGVFPGAENWSGAVFFTENLAHPDVLGPKLVAESAYERRVTKRGFYIYNGHAAVGIAYKNAETFQNCYTCFRPTYDHYLAELAKSFGATILTRTTVSSLIRDNGKIIGVHTDRGPIFADVVFLAEGDASHLVTKEGYERIKKPHEPHFLQGIREVIACDPRQIEKNFGVANGEGAAFEVVLRNGSIRNRVARLNMGGFIYTNKESLSVGLVLPLDNLAREFDGDHNRLMEWFKSLPQIRRWLGGSTESIAYGAKIIRGGGFHEMPQLVDHGLAIGGAATGIGLDFPYPNFTGPATAMGKIFADAVKQIRKNGKNFSIESLENLYVGPLKQTHYFKNVEFLQNWPRYIERTQVFFGRNVDLITGSLFIASHRELRAPQKIWQLAKFVRETLRVREFWRDFRQQRDALGLCRVTPNAQRLTPRVATGGACTLEFLIDGESQHDFLWPISRFFRKLPQILAVSADHLYRNDDTPLPLKLRNAIAAARRHLGIWEYLSLTGVAILLAVLAPIQWLCEMIKLIVTRPSPEKFLSSFFQKHRALVRKRMNLDASAVKISQPFEEKLALIRYFSEENPHIKVLRPPLFQNRADVAKSALWHICPAKVYESATDDLGQSLIIVNYENCVKCESCWRGSPDVDWSRHKKQRLIYQVHVTDANAKLLALLKSNQRKVVIPRSSRDLVLKNAPEVVRRIEQFSRELAAEPRFLDENRKRWLLGLLEEIAQFVPDLPKSVLENVRAGKFFWAEADLLQYRDRNFAPLPQFSSDARDADREKLREKIDALFPKQSIKDLEHGQPLTAEQREFLLSLAKFSSRSVALEELARKDPSLAVLVGGHFPAQFAAHEWIGLTAARTEWKNFPQPSALPLAQVAEDFRAIALGAGNMLLERTLAHAMTRVQFPGLFHDEDGHDSLVKFGSVKKLISEMEAQRFLLESLENFAEADAPVAKILATEAFGPDEGSLAHNAGQVFGGTAYSEDDVLSKFYRDSSVFPHLLFENEKLLLELGRSLQKSGLPKSSPLQISHGSLLEIAENWRVARENLTIFAPRSREKGDAGALAIAQTYKNLYALERILTRCREKFANATLTERELEIARHFAAKIRPAAEYFPHSAELGAAILEHGYFEQPLEKPPTFSYADAIASGGEYDYGDFLLRKFDPDAWRYAPEMQFCDTRLRKYHDDLAQFFRKYAEKKFDGLTYQRYVEKLHMIPLDDVREMIRRGFLRMPIPKELGGEEKLKAEYYILIQHTMRKADPAYALTIQANTSIGTTPILLALNNDLPRAQHDLGEFLKNPAFVSEMRDEISRILRMLDSPQALKVKDVFTKLFERVRADLGKKPMLRAVGGDFFTHFFDAARAGQRMDLENFRAELEKSLAELEKFAPRARELLDEIGRRIEACKLYLRFIAAGQISAYALTEPNAGSDSGGVQTRAELKRVEVFSDEHGFKYFMWGNERRYILDAATVDVTKIDYSGYDYATSAGIRRYEGREFHDIAQLRRENGREYYEFFELNGAKMWITNAHIAGVFILYAKTPEGVTGFIVDRHAEGLVVGNDEEKMGQRGSPTNELGLTSVRVPRENIIGLEGRGQVNALETLNVGRAGLAVSAAAVTGKIIEQTRAFAREHKLDELDWVQQLIGEMAAEHYAAESIAFELIGLFDNHATKSVRMESAIGKFYNSEALHRVIARAEKIYGIEGQTAAHELEKHRRDARVLTIYEGTNEVQRFLILRDLVDSILPKWKEIPPADDKNFAAVDNARAILRDKLREACETFGPLVWQNPNFQPTMFKLTDIAAHIKTIDAVLWRTHWLKKNIGDDAPEADRRHRDMAVEAQNVHLKRAWREIERLRDAFDREFLPLKQGIYSSDIRICTTRLHEDATTKRHKPLRIAPPHKITRPLHIVVLVKPVALLSPRPRVRDGELLETYFEISSAERTALETALEIKNAAPDRVRVSVVSAAPRYALELLRETLALGADDATLLETPHEFGEPHATARILGDHLALKQTPLDLILCGAASPDDNLGLVGPLVAANFGCEFVTRAAEIYVETTESCASITANLADFSNATLKKLSPLLVSLVARDTPHREFSTDDYVAALEKPLEIVAASQIDAEPEFSISFSLPEAPSAEEKGEITVESAAELARELLGLAKKSALSAEKLYEGEIETVEISRVARELGAVFVARNAVNGAISAAKSLAEACELPFSVTIFGNFDESAIRKIAAETGAPTFFVTNSALDGASAEGFVAAMQRIWKDTLPQLLMASATDNEIVARFANTFPRILAHYNVARIAQNNGHIELVAPIFGGKVHALTQIRREISRPRVVTFTENVASSEKAGGARVFHAPLEFEYARERDELAKLMRETARETAAKTISAADVLIDVGYAVRDREKFEMVVTPLKRALENLGAKNVMVGGTRKVVEELKLLGSDAQIGQTGLSVNPKLLIALGVSGAPQHVDYIGERATIIAFNKDAEAPLMTLNKRRARPRVVPLVGDLYGLAPKFIAALESK